MEAAKREALSSAGASRRQRQQSPSSLFAPRAIVLLESSDVLNHSDHRGATVSPNAFCSTVVTAVEAHEVQPQGRGVGGGTLDYDEEEHDSEANDLRSSHNSSSKRSAVAAAAVIEASTEAVPVGGWFGGITSTPLSLSPHLVETGESMPVGHLRPEFIFVRVLKETPTSPLGISLRQRMDHVCITRVKKGGLLWRDGSSGTSGSSSSRALVRPGDRVLAINGVSCIRSSAAKVAKLVRNAKSEVSIVLWNKDGDPNLVSCTVQKPRMDSKVGVCIKNDHGAVRVSRVRPDGLFAGSLLLPGHRCIQINGVRTDGFQSKDAASMISLCNDFVTIVSRPRQECAMVLSCEVHASDWFRNMCGRITAVRAVTAVASHSLHV
jgi:hypothetical protein